MFPFRHSVIRHSDLIRHSDFVIWIFQRRFPSPVFEATLTHNVQLPLPFPRRDLPLCRCGDHRPVRRPLDQIPGCRPSQGTGRHRIHQRLSPLWLHRKPRRRLRHRPRPPLALHHRLHPRRRLPHLPLPAAPAVSCMYQFILGMLLAGVWGNLYDRFQFGYVRDA